MNHQNEVCILATNLSQLDASMLSSLLEASGIPSFVKDRGSGGYMRVYMGYTVFGQDVYVGQIDYEKAMLIYNDYINTCSEEEAEDLLLDIDENEYQTDYDTTSSMKYMKPSTVARFIILTNLLVILAILLYNWLT